MIPMQAPPTQVEPSGQAVLTMHPPISGLSRKNCVCGTGASRTIFNPSAKSEVNDTGLHDGTWMSVVDSKL
jgi:hypothetical protein